MRFRVLSRVAASACAIAIAVGALGCAHTDSAPDRHIAEMREVIGKVQAEQDRANQRADLLDSSERGLVETTAPGQAAKSSAVSSARPVRAVQIGDADETYESDDPDDPSARPEIRLQGTPGVGRPSRARTHDRDPHDDGRLDGPRPSSSSSVLDPEAKRAYDAALAQVHDKQYERALESLSSFLVRWPDHPYAENATYWRGECYFARGEYLKAAEQFEAVVVRSGGTGAKAPDALLKMGMSHDRLGAPERAREYWDRLRRDYPRSDAARKIPQGNKSDGNKSGPSGPKESR